MKRSIALFIIAGFALTACFSSNPASATIFEDKLAEIQARGTLIIATDADYAPQSRLIPGVLPNPDTKCEPSQYTAEQFTGLDIEVGMEIARQLGVEPCFVTPPWSQLVGGNWGDNWDIHAGSVTITYERMNVLYFSQPYYASPTVILLRKENSVFKTPEDLSGKRVGVCAGCTFEAYLQGTLQIPGKKFEYLIKNPQIIVYENEGRAIDTLSIENGAQLDAVITILPKALTVIEAGRPLKIMDQPILFEYLSVTLDRSSKRDPMRLLSEITKFIQEMHRTGLLKKLSIQYQGLDFTQEAAQFDIDSLHQTP